MAAWDAGAPADSPAGEAPLGVTSAPASPVQASRTGSDLRPPAGDVIQSVIQKVNPRVAERASDERHNSTNVSHD